MTIQLSFNINNLNSSLQVGRRLMKQDLYFDFIMEYPDYAPKAKMTISRTRFYKWLTSYSIFTTGVNPEEGRDPMGRWIIINEAPSNELKKQ